MKLIYYILLMVSFMGVAMVSQAAETADKANKTDKESALQKTTKGVAKGIDNLVEGIKQMPGAISKAAKKIENSDDEK